MRFLFVAMFEFSAIELCLWEKSASRREWVDQEGGNFLLLSNASNCPGLFQNFF
jgi:antibiotic biosynthesis monooxygenase (ABM) superfamily enzyme